MASWIVHLRVADRLLDRIEGVSPVQFLVGNLAPDCGALTAVPGEYDPPNRITHYSPGGKKRDCEPWRFRDEYLPDPDPARHSFYLGYYTHLQVDALWHRLVFLPIERAHAEEFAVDPARVFVMKEDWYDLDRRFLREHPRFRAFETVRQVRSFPNIYLPFYSRDAIQDQLRYIVSFYGPTDRDLDRPYPYLDQAAMDAFIGQAAEEIYRTLEKDGLSAVPPGENR